MSFVGSSTEDLPRIDQSWEISEMNVLWLSSGSCNGALDDNSGVDVLPERHEKFARKGDDRGFLLATTILRPLAP